MAKTGRKNKQVKDQNLEENKKQTDEDLVMDVPFDEYSEAYYFELSPADLRDDSDDEGQKKTKGRKKGKK